MESIRKNMTDTEGKDNNCWRCKIQKMQYILGVMTVIVGTVHVQCLDKKGSKYWLNVAVSMCECTLVHCKL